MGEMQELPFRDEDEPLLYTVSQLNALVRELLEVNFPEIWVEGEISNFRKYPSGHLYFTLKDESSEINAVMFNQLSAYLDFQPEDGMNVLALGTVTLYGPRGKYQLEVRRMKPAGLGRLQLAFERLKERLKAEGLFDELRKRPIPPLPERIGIVTSAEGAVIRDILSIISRRYPLVELLVFPVKVQGEGAAEEIAHGIERANLYHLEREKIDVLIVGRGGGSLEDLWAFNEEIVARAIFHSKIPVISAVGHEIDFTIADFVADLRAPTPSAAAELVVPDRDEISSRLTELLRSLRHRQQTRLDDLHNKLDLLVSSYALRRPLRRLSEHRQTLDHRIGLLLRAYRARERAAHERLGALLGRLEAVSPAAVLRRGYAVVEDERGRIVKSALEVRPHQRVTVQLHRGRLDCEVLAAQDVADARRRP
jgi:exodeoxyribonuclease VII large subunit